MIIIIECRFTLKRVHDMKRTHSQTHRTDNSSQLSSIIWPVCLNGWVFVYELSGYGFESHCSHLNFRFRACFEKDVPWHSGNHRVCIHSETRTWHDKNIQTLLNVGDSNYHIVIDNSFTSPELLRHLGSKQIATTGIVRVNRVENTPLQD